MFRECHELLYGRFPLRPKGAVYKHYAGPAILHGSEALYLKENEMEISLSTDRYMVRALCVVQLKDRQILRTLC